MTIELQDELHTLYDIVRLGQIDDHLDLSLDDWARRYKTCNPELMTEALIVIARHPDANVLRVLRVLRAWNPADLKFLVDFLR